MELKFKLGFKNKGGIYWQILTLDEIRTGLCAFNNRKPDYTLLSTTSKDIKTGAEIYEGDIVKCGKSKDAPEALVVFLQQSFLLEYLPIEKYKNQKVYDYMDDYKYFYIIGNKFDNAEMLDGQPIKERKVRVAG